MNNFDNLPEDIIVGVGPKGVVISDMERVYNIFNCRMN